MDVNGLEKEVYVLYYKEIIKNLIVGEEIKYRRLKVVSKNQLKSHKRSEIKRGYGVVKKLQ